MTAHDRELRARAARERWGKYLWTSWLLTYAPEVEGLSVPWEHEPFNQLDTIGVVWRGMNEGTPDYIEHRALFDAGSCSKWALGRFVFQHMLKTRTADEIQTELDLISEVLFGDGDESWEEIAANRKALQSLTDRVLPEGIPHLSPGEWEALWAYVDRFETT